MKRLYLIVLAGMALSLPGLSLCDPLSITPYISVSQEYSDNIMFSAADKKSDAITSLTAGLKVKRDGERLDATLNTRVNQLVYREYDELNDLEYYIKGELDYRITERLTTRASAGYKKDTRRDYDPDSTGLLVAGDRKTASLSLGSDYLVSELGTVGVSLDFSKVELVTADQEENNDSFGLNLSFNRNLSSWYENTVGMINLNYMHYRSESTVNRGLVFYPSGGGIYAGIGIQDQENSSDVFQLSAGFSHDITELYNVFAYAGASYTQTVEQVGYRYLDPSTQALVMDVPGSEIKDGTMGGVLSAGVNYRDEYWDANLTLSRDMRGGTGTSGTVERTSVSGSLDRRVTSDFFLTLRASCYLNQNERKSQGVSDTDELTMSIQPGFRYRMDRDFILTGSYRFTSEEDRENNITRERSLVYLQLKKEFEF